VALALGYTHTCALRSSGEVLCWGSDFDGELARGPHPWLGHRYVVDRKAPSPEGFSLGIGHACIVDEPAPVCWGALEYGHAAFRQGPAEGNPVVAAAGATAVTSGWLTACSARPGAAICWGDDLDGGSSASMLPEVHAMAVAKDFRCAVAGPERKLWCWGWDGPVHLPEDKRATTAKQDPALLTDATSIVAVGAGKSHVCWGAEDGLVTCQGSFYDFDGKWHRSPSQAVKLGKLPGLEHIAGGDAYTCALAKGRVWCWGRNMMGQLGSGSWVHPGERSVIEIDVQVETLAAGARHACAVGEGGGVWCWGENDDGQLGTGDRIATNAPRRVLGVAHAVAVKAADRGSCAIRNDGEVICWGLLARWLFGPREKRRAHEPARALALGAERPELAIVRKVRKESTE
jgi:alpha-tubulin suppressor-like RCC1 family protein